MKKLILKSKRNGIKHLVTIVETESIKYRYPYCLKTITNTYKDKVKVCNGILNEYFETYEEMRNKYELIKEVNSSRCSFFVIKEYEK